MCQTCESPPKIERRRFLALLGAAGALWALAACVFPVFKYLSFKSQSGVFDRDGRARVEKAALSDLASPGRGKNAAYGGRGLVIFRSPAGELKAFDSKCTHAGCNVAFEGNRIFCNCHGGVYDLDGRNIAGPPPKPLTELRVIQEGDALYVAPLDKAEA